ncbi:MAG: hypothetical protein R3182_13230 [Draconibacterium sp.]|nr:hypothetical protein [Draconibacterium sp.]
MSSKKCPECGGNIIMKYIVPEKIFTINDNDTIKKRPPLNPMDEQPQLTFVCEDDAEHDLEKDPTIDKWTDDLFDKFYQEKMYAR